MKPNSTTNQPRAIKPVFDPEPPMRFFCVPVELLHPSPQNARCHSSKQIRQIAKSIKEFGFTNPILVDEKFAIIAGHGRYDAAVLLGLKDLPIIQIRGLTNPQKRALRLADNRIAENASWDRKILAAELQALIEVNFDVEITGFEIPEIDILIGHPDQSPDKTEALIEPIRNAPPVAAVGDLWRLGKHSLLCGTSLEESSYSRLLVGELAEMVFADGPYNIVIDGGATGKGKTRHPEFQMASGEMSSDEYIDFLRRGMELLAKFSKQDSIHFQMIDWRHVLELLLAARNLLELKNLCVWAKTNGGMGSFYRSQHEFVAVLKNGKGPHINNIALGKWGRSRTNLWTYSGVNAFRKGRTEDLTDHPTVKPFDLVADAILDCSNIGGLVLDPFAGSGTTILACERTKRRAAAIEIDPYYVDVAIRRFEKMTGIQAIHSATGLTFAEVRAQPTSQSPETER